MIYYKVVFATTNCLRLCIERYDMTDKFARPALICLLFGKIYSSNNKRIFFVSIKLDISNNLTVEYMIII
jgi:hypothetical protein